MNLFIYLFIFICTIYVFYDLLAMCFGALLVYGLDSGTPVVSKFGA